MDFRTEDRALRRKSLMPGSGARLLAGDLSGRDFPGTFSAPIPCAPAVSRGGVTIEPRGGWPTSPPQPATTITPATITLAPAEHQRKRREFMVIGDN